MKVYIEVTDWYKRFTGGKRSMEIEVVVGAKALEAVLHTGIPRDEVGFITLDNGSQEGQCKLVNEDTILSEGDRLKVYPLLVGG